MSTSLFTGLSGLRAHETYLDVIGNNIANANTVGYRGSRVTFGDLLSITMSPGAAPTTTQGGKNPKQLGLGVAVNSISANTNAGSLIATARNLDLTIFGNAYFVVNDGSRNLYTRAGTFGLDGSGQLVELGTGHRVQSLTGSSIIVPPNAVSAPQQTSEITLKGNLPAVVEGPLPEILTSVPFADGTAATLSGSGTGPFSFSDGDEFTVEVDGGVAQTITFNAADFTAIGANIAAATASEVAQIVNQQLVGATASANGSSVDLASDSVGDASTLLVTDSTGAPATTLGLSTTLTSGTQSAAAATTDLNDLVNNATDYVNGDTILIEGTDQDGAAFAGSFVYGTDGTTLGDLQSFVDGLAPGATVELDPSGSGALVLTSDTTGEAAFSLLLSDGPANTGSTDWNQTAFSLTQDGSGPDTVETAITVYDSNGVAHVVSLQFERVDGSEWQLTASLPDEPGINILDPSVGSITFDSQGILQTTAGSGVADGNIQIAFPSGTQTISLSLGDPGEIDGLTQFGDTATAQAIAQDGYPLGSLVDVQVTETGDVRGVFSNGQFVSYGTVALATFANPGGLLREGNNMFAESVNSGLALLGSTASSGSAIQAGALESSNVDLAEELVRLTEAQRGYQASSRIIRASEELLQTLLQNI